MLLKLKLMSMDSFLFFCFVLFVFKEGSFKKYPQPTEQCALAVPHRRYSKAKGVHCLGEAGRSSCVCRICIRSSHSYPADC